jgi:hypothetical protein
MMTELDPINQHDREVFFLQLAFKLKFDALLRLSGIRTNVVLPMKGDNDTVLLSSILLSQDHLTSPIPANTIFLVDRNELALERGGYGEGHKTKILPNFTNKACRNSRFQRVE